MASFIRSTFSKTGGAVEISDFAGIPIWGNGEKLRGVIAGDTSNDDEVEKQFGQRVGLIGEVGTEFVDLGSGLCAELREIARGWPRIGDGGMTVVLVNVQV